MYSFYSLFLSLAIITVRLLTENDIFLAGELPTASLLASSLYVLLAAVFVTTLTLNPDAQVAIAYIFAETLLLSVIMLSAGGLNSSLSSLILISVVMGNLLAPGILGLAVAAWVTVAVFFIEHLWTNNYDPQALANSGTYGLLTFIVAIVTQALARRLNTALEITQQQAEHLQRLRDLTWQALLDSPAGIIACDNQDRVIFYNEKAQTLTGIQSNDLLPHSLKQAAFSAEFEPMISLQGVNLGLKTVSLNDSQSGDYLIYMEDQSQLEEAAQQLKLASLGRLTASIAHEIRNPLSALRQATQLLSEASDLTSSDRFLTQIAEQNCMRIDRIVEDVLALSRKRQAQMENLKLQPWLEDFCCQFRSQQSNRLFSIKVDCEDDLTVSFDPLHLQQILHNLCANGLKYATKHKPEAPQLTIRARSRGLQVWLETLDNGAGIPESQREHLFEPFHTTEHQGTGLGLYMCRELCHANRASIQYLRDDQQSCFRVVLRSGEKM
ncbi:MAG: sensor histidine kinase [Oceanobacter sp.]